MWLLWLCHVKRLAFPVGSFSILKIFRRLTLVQP